MAQWAGAVEVPAPVPSSLSVIRYGYLLTHGMGVHTVACRHLLNRKWFLSLQPDRSQKFPVILFNLEEPMQAPQKQTFVKMQGRVSNKQLITSELILRLLEEVASFLSWHSQFPSGKVLSSGKFHGI